MTQYLELLRECLDALYNPFEPDNQSKVYLKVKAALAAPEHAAPARVADGVAAIPSADEVTAKEQSGAAPASVSIQERIKFLEGYYGTTIHRVECECELCLLRAASVSPQAPTGEAPPMSLGERLDSSIRVIRALLNKREIDPAQWGIQSELACCALDNAERYVKSILAKHDSGQRPTAEGADWVKRLRDKAEYCRNVVRYSGPDTRRGDFAEFAELCDELATALSAAPRPDAGEGPTEKKS